MKYQEQSQLNTSNLNTILQNLGYTLVDCGESYRTSAVYRGGNNRTSLCIWKNTGSWKDFVSGESGNVYQLIAKTLNLKNIKDIPKELKLRGIEEIVENSQQSEENIRPKIIAEKIFPEEMLIKLLPKFDFYVNRGISKETMFEFKAGYATQNKMYRRIVFPIYNLQKKIVGFSGRYVFDKKKADGQSVPKWKHIGQKLKWIYPAFLNQSIIKEKKEVILVESIGDLLALWEAGVKNVLCIFGTQLGSKVLAYLISLNLKKIIIATNNDFASPTKNVGLEAAEKMRAKMFKFIDKQNILIKLPQKKDFGEMNEEEIITWYKSCE